MNILDFIKSFNANIQEKYVDINVTGNKKEQTYNIIFTFKSMLDVNDIIHFYNECNIFFTNPFGVLHTNFVIIAIYLFC